MLIFTEILVLIFGFILLSLSLTRHYNRVTEQRVRLSKRVMLVFRLGGLSLLIIAIILAVNIWGVALGLVYWFALATLVILLLSMLLTYKPQYLFFILPLLMLTHSKSNHR